MRRFNYLFLISILSVFMFTSCEENNENNDNDNSGESVLTVYPEYCSSSAIPFPDKIRIDVSAENDMTWNAISDKDWCVVEQDKGCIYLEITQINRNSAERLAKITITASNGDKKTVPVTQSAPLPLPSTEGNFKSSISDRKWAFPDDSPYESLEFDDDYTYSLMRKSVGSSNKTEDIAEEDLFMCGTYSIDTDLKSVILNNFGSIRLDINEGYAAIFTVKPTNKEPHEYIVYRLRLPDITKESKKIKTLRADGDNSYTFTYENDKLIKADINFAVYWSGWSDSPRYMSSTIDIINNKYQLTMLGKFPCYTEDNQEPKLLDMSLVYNTNTDNYSAKYRVMLRFNDEYITKFKYNAAGQLVSSVYLENGIIQSYTSAVYKEGNIVKETNINSITNSRKVTDFTYWSHENKGGALMPYGMFDRLYINHASGEIYDTQAANLLAYYAGVLGAPVKNIIKSSSVKSNTGGTVSWTPTLDSDGYPTNMFYKDPKENTDWELTFE